MTRIALFLLLLATPLLAAPPEVPPTLKLKVGEDSTVVVKVADGKKGAYREGFKAADCLFFRGYSPDESTMTFLIRPKKAGFFVVPFWTVGEGTSSVLEIDATGEVPPGPGPEPPKPEPPVVVSGKRRLLLVHESADDTPEVSRLLVALRAGTAAAYLSEKGHKLSILDDDSVDASGKPAADVEQWRPHFSGLKLPVLFVLDETGKTLIHKQELSAGTTAAQVVEIVKGKGG